MENNNIICSISITNGMYDNDYTFYEDGRVKHYYDKNNFNYDNTEWIPAGDIRYSDKIKIPENCDENLRERLGQLMGINTTSN